VVQCSSALSSALAGVRRFLFLSGHSFLIIILERVGGNEISD